MIFYKTYNWELNDNILKVEVEKETEKCVWIKGRKNNKRTDFENYFKTFLEAKNFVISKKEKKKLRLQKEIEDYRQEINKILEIIPKLEELTESDAINDI